ncbi:MAG: hypothetical protein DYG98_13680 [Haliscomenobacteraceae bacterium CHB4]|nr:hypothetical protein [Haliscomenobacteraceae bacterium CHB4]
METNKWLGKPAMTFCYRSEQDCKEDFEYLKSGKMNNPIPKGGMVAFCIADNPRTPNQFWIVCINLRPGPWLNKVDVSDRYSATADKFFSESLLIDFFET